MVKVSFIGAGGVGLTTAFATGLKLGNELKEVVLVDVSEELANARGVDLRQGFILNGLDTKVIGTTDYNKIAYSDVIVITSSIPPKPGVSDREAMMRDNKVLIADIANKLKAVIPTDDKQPLIIVVSNPLDIILNHFLKTGNFNKKKTIGSGNLLDTGRLQDHLSRETGVDPSKIKTFAVAQHGAKIVYLLSKTTIDDKPLSDFNIKPERLKEIVNNSINGAKEIIEKGACRTLYGPALSIFDLMISYIKDKKNLLTCATYLDGQYGVNDFTFGVPVILGKDGVEEIKVWELTEEEKNDYEEAYKFTIELNG
ncbi:MAG: malate dehydrogenase [Rickettsiales bacterium]|nr:MAG: malate dehydrogenase [Rickettsiales bacterium]